MAREKMWCWSTAPLGTQFGKSSVRTPCLPHSATIRRGRLVHTDYVCACYNCVRLKEHPRKPADPSLFCRQRTVSKRKRLAVSTFLRSRRWRWLPSAGATSRPSRAHRSCAPTNALTPCPDPPHPISAIPDRSRPSAVPRNGAATEQNGKKRPDGGRKRCCGRQPKGTSGRGDPWPGMCSRGQPRGASKALLPAQLACYSARASDPRGGSRWGSCHRPGAATSARGARQDAQEGAVAWGWGAHASVCRPASAGCAPPTLSASGLPLSDAAHTTGRSD